MYFILKPYILWLSEWKCNFTQLQRCWVENSKVELALSEGSDDKIVTWKLPKKRLLSQYKEKEIHLTMQNMIENSFIYFISAFRKIPPWSTVIKMIFVTEAASNYSKSRENRVLLCQICVQTLRKSQNKAKHFPVTFSGLLVPPWGLEDTR